MPLAVFQIAYNGLKTHSMAYLKTYFWMATND